MTSEFKNLIGGKWVDASDGGTFANRSPAAPDVVLGTFPKATREDARRAISVAREALPGWKATPPPRRGELLDHASRLLMKRRDEIARVLTQEEGKTLPEATAEVIRAADIFKYYAGEGWRMSGAVLPSTSADELLYTRREPLGLITVITPWNFPIAIPAWKIAPALVYGNAVLFKPASDAPHTALLLTEVLLETGLPPGVLSLLTGSGSEVGDELIANAGVDGISFTGSYTVGDAIYSKAVRNMTRVQLEMGGKNPLIVLDDADLTLAVNLAVKGGFGLTGQACTASSRVIAEEGIAPTFVEALVEAARSLKVGDGLEPGIQMGPAVNQGQLETDLRYVALGKQEGARLVAGGDRAGDGGYFIQPTVFDEVHPEMRLAQEEIFGPIVGVIHARDFDDALERANAVGYGLSAGIVTNNLQKAFTFASEIEAGVVKINGATSGVALNAPFGGFKQSSANTFKEQGQAAIEFYTRTKSVYVNHG
jgi:aldehyde dehydrogenase (NAD+)